MVLVNKLVKMYLGFVAGGLALGVGVALLFPRSAPEPAPQPAPSRAIPRVSLPEVSNPHLSRIHAFYPTAPGTVDLESAGKIEAYAKQVRADAAAMEDKAKAQELLDDLDMTLTDVHFAIAAKAYSYIQNKNLGYGDDKTLADVCAAVSKDDMKQRVTMLKAVMDDNMARTKTPITVFRTTPLSHHGHDPEEFGALEVETAKKDVQSQIDGLLVEIDGLQGCGGKAVVPAKASP